MLEGFYQYDVLVRTGQWSPFLIYVIFAWAVMLPRALGGMIFRSFRPEEPTQLSVRYLLKAGIGTWVVVVAQHHYTLDGLHTLEFMLALTIAALLLFPPILREVLRHLFQWTFYAGHVNLVEQEGPAEARTMIAMITIYKEDPEELGKSLKHIRTCLEWAYGDFVIVAAVDGCEDPIEKYVDPKKHAIYTIPVAKEFCHIVLTSNAKKKRANLEAMGLLVYERDFVKTGEEIFHFIDSDTKPADKFVAEEINRPFTDPKVGGVTSAQYIDNPQTVWQQIMQIYETIRNLGSQAFMTLAGAIGCLPGRWYGVLAKYLTPDDFRDLNTHSFSWFGWLVTSAKRVMTGTLLRQCLEKEVKQF